MSRYEQFKATSAEIDALEEWVKLPDGGSPYAKFLIPLAEARITELKARFDEPTPTPVEPVKPKAKRGDVDGAVKEQLVALAENGSGPEHIDWATWARDHKLNRKSVLAAVRRHEKNKT